MLKLKRIIKRQLKNFMIVLVILSLAISGLGFTVNTADAALDQVGPVNPSTGFPYWYKDSNGIALELMEAADGFGISAPVEAGNAFSGQIGFGAEGFWWSAGASIDGTIPKQATLVLALEAAFAGESAVDGEQSAFGRIRYRVNALTPGETYTVRHPFGNVTEVADIDGIINVTSDIGCFAVAGASSCDPNHPLGSPLPQFNFGAALSSGVGPFLTWTTFNPNPALTDPQLSNPAYPDNQYVGNPAVDHTVTGSPINQNIFRVEGPGLPGGAIQTDLFSVTGRIAAPAAPAISPISNRTVQAGTPISFTVTATDTNLDPVSFSIASSTANTNEAEAVIGFADGVFSWTPAAATTSVFTIGASDGTLTSTTSVMIAVTETAPALASISVTPATATLTIGATRQLAAAALDSNGGSIVPAPAIAWTSSNETIATVNALGLVTAIASGTATITASSSPISGTAQVTVTPAAQTGGGLVASIPVEPGTGFPKWYKDRNGLALDLMEAADTFGISAPVEPANPFSAQIGFGPEGFWSSADASINTTASKPAVLVQAVEAAFAGESAVNGQQSAFGRIRIRVDVNDPGTYTVIYPYGQKTYTIAADAIGAGYEINDTNDIGCFAIPGVSSCDPGNPLGSPQSAFNFNAVGLSEVGPFLTWSTYDSNPALNDPLLTNLAYPTRKYVGNPSVAHAIKGSPTGNNFFRIEGPVGADLDPAEGVQNTIETNLFTVTGRLADVTPPEITILGANPAEVPMNGVYNDAGATATDDFDGDITARIIATGLPLNTTASGTLEVVYTVSDIAGNTATATRTVNVIEDITPPVITVLGLNSVNIIVGSAYTDAGATAQDNFSGNLTASIATSTDFNPAVIGAYSFVYTVSDAAGNTATATRTVNVVDVPPAPPVLTSITVTPATSTLITGQTLQLAALPLDQFGNLFMDATVVWFSDSLLSATVNPAGLVTGAIPSAIPANIVAQAAIGETTVTGTSSITVISVPDVIAPVITIQGANPASVVQGTAYVDAGATAIDNVDPVVTVLATSTVDTAVVGAYFVTYTATDAALNIATATRTVNVTPAPPVLATIGVTPNPGTVVMGNTVQMAASPLDQYGAPIAAAILWTTSDPNIATVDASGLVTPVSGGLVNITAASGVISGSSTLNVVVPVLTSIVVTPNPADITVNSANQMTASSLDQFGNPIAAAITWTSSNLAVANIDNTGLVMAFTAGSATITASSGAVSGQATVNVSIPPAVNMAPVISAIVDQAVEVNKNLRMFVAATDPNGDAITYSLISSPLEAQIKANTGEFNFKSGAAGAYAITVRASDPSGLSATLAFTINVSQSAAVPLVGGGGGGAKQGAINAVNVPLTVGKSQSGRIDTVFPSLGQASVQVPQGAVNSPTTFNVKPGSLNASMIPSATAGAFLVGNQVFNISALDKNNQNVRNFNGNLTITLPVPQGNFNSANLAVYYFNDTVFQWVLVPNAIYDPAANRFTFTVNHLTNFAIFQAEKKLETIDAVKANDGRSAEGSAKKDGAGKEPKRSAGKALGVKIFKDETLVRTKDGKIFVVVNNTKRRIANLDELKGYAGRKISSIDDDAINNMAAASRDNIKKLGVKEGSLIRGSNGKIFVIKNSKKFSVSSLNELRKRFIGKPIIKAGDDILLFFPTADGKKPLIAKNN